MGKSWAPLPAPVASLEALRIEGSYRFFTRRAASRQPPDAAGSEFVYPLSLPAQLPGLFTGYVSHCPMGLLSPSPFLTSEALVGPRHSLASPELFSSRPTRAISLVHLLADVSGTGVVADICPFDYFHRIDELNNVTWSWSCSKVYTRFRKQD
jgi:hypothetical protein